MDAESAKSASDASVNPLDSMSNASHIVWVLKRRETGRMIMEIDDQIDAAADQRQNDRGKERGEPSERHRFQAKPSFLERRREA